MKLGRLWLARIDGGELNEVATDPGTWVHDDLQKAAHAEINGEKVSDIERARLLKQYEHLRPRVVRSRLRDQQAKTIKAAVDWISEDRSAYPHWPWESVQKAVGSFGKGDVVTVGGVPGNGKSALGLNVLRHLAEAGVPCSYVPLEVSAHVAMSWVAGHRLGFPRWWFQKGLSEVETEQVKAEMAELKKLPIYFDPRDSMTPVQLIQQAEDVAEAGARVVIVDHLQHLSYEGRNLRQEVGEAMKVLKATAKKLGITFLVFSQLSRRQGDRLQRWRIPDLSELKETGYIEQISDIVLFVHRGFKEDSREAVKAYQERRGPASDFEEPNTLYLHVAKHRFGLRTGHSLRLHIHDDRITGSEGEE